MLVDFLKLIWKNLGSLLLAFFLAIIIWIFAANSSDPNQELEYPESIALTIIGKENNLVFVGDIPDNILTTLRAPNSVWDKLLSNEDYISANIDLSELGVGIYQLPINVIVGIEPVRIIDITPNLIRFSLEELNEINHKIETNIVGEPALGYQLDGFKLSVNQVNISGPESLINQIDTVVADINVSGLRGDSSSEEDIKILDIAGNRIDGLEISPSKILVEQFIAQTPGHKDVVVRVETIGKVQDGYRVTSISAYPQIVPVSSSNPQIVNGMPGFVWTNTLDLTNANDDIEVNLVLQLPDGVVLESEEQFILVQVGIAPIESYISLKIPIEIINLDIEFDAILSPTEIDVSLSGPVPILDQIGIDDIVIVVDLLDLTVGTHLLTPTVVTFPERIFIDAINPEIIEVEIIISSDSENGTQTVENPIITSTPNP